MGGFFSTEGPRGPKGDKGDKGDKGVDGVSPPVSVPVFTSLQEEFLRNAEVTFNQKLIDTKNITITYLNYYLKLNQNKEKQYYIFLYNWLNNNLTSANYESFTTYNNLSTNIISWLETNTTVFSETSIDNRLEADNIIKAYVSFQLLNYYRNTKLQDVYNYILGLQESVRNTHFAAIEQIQGSVSIKTNKNVITIGNNITKYIICNDLPPNRYSLFDKTSVQCSSGGGSGGSGGSGFRSGPSEPFKDFSFKGVYFNSKYIPKEYHSF